MCFSITGASIDLKKLSSLHNVGVPKNLFLNVWRHCQQYHVSIRCFRRHSFSWAIEHLAPDRFLSSDPSMFAPYNAVFPAYIGQLVYHFALPKYFWRNLLRETVKKRIVDKPRLPLATGAFQKAVQEVGEVTKLPHKAQRGGLKHILKWAKTALSDTKHKSQRTPKHNLT